MFRLGGLVNVSQGELHTIQTLSQASNLVQNPLLLPYKLLTVLALQLPGDQAILVRTPAVIVSLCSIGLFFILAQRWYGRLNGLAITTLFATTGWMLQTGRYGAGFGTLTLLVLGLLNLVVWTNTTEKSNRAILVFAASSGLALFIPGGLWFVLAAVVICREALMEHLGNSSATHKAIGGSILGFALIVLAMVFLRDLSVLRQWLGLPAELPSLVILLKQAALSISGLVVRGPVLTEVWLAHTPLLDTAATALLGLGVVFYSRHLRNSRTLLLASFFIIGILLTTLNGAAGLSYLVPLAYLVLGGGFAFLLHQWKKVFPHNPIAEGVALTLVSVMVICMIGFHLQRYFVAWRYSPSTVEAYRKATNDGNQPPYLIQ